ncbi:MAG: DegT/DnrJ/EryC1/StrS family aminotransferase [Desulfobacterota bacterium]|nr:DegT/DnrJ/EryC1/StrS family aminotransferase [Thermodesulfobacteriota bacterium]
MSIFRDIPPTAGFPLHAQEIVAAITCSRGEDPLADDFKKYLNAPYARTTCSGTAALFFICCAIQKMTSRRTILIPSFICPLVPLALRRAGFTVAVCDIGAQDFNFDQARLETICAANRDIAAVVINHLAGIPADVEASLTVARKHNIIVIEDCAQALGAFSKDRKVGTLGDFAFFSFAAGKGLTMYEGGMMATMHEQYASLLDDAAALYAPRNAALETVRVLQLFGYWLFYRPALFWFVFTLPQQLWHLCGNDIRALREHFNLNFPLHAVSRFRIGVAHSAFTRLDGEIAQQREKALWYFRKLEGCRGVRLLQESSGDRATYPYVTVVFDDPAARNKVLQHCVRAGIGISQIYARAIGDYPYLKKIVPAEPYDNGRLIVKRTLTLSTNTFLTEKDADEVVRIIKEML